MAERPAGAVGGPRAPRGAEGFSGGGTQAQPTGEPSAPPVTAGGGTLTLLTVNLWNGRAQPAALDAALRDHAPDVVLAQELSPCAAEVLAAHYRHTSLRPRTDTFGMGMASRHPAEFQDLPMPRRDFIVARLRPPGFAAFGAPVELINVHLSCPDRLHRWPERAVQVRRLLALQRATPGPRVLAGDFNTAAPMPAYFALRGLFSDAAFQVALRRRDLRAWPRPTWGPTASSPRIARIDHVLVSGLVAIDIRTLRIAGSDHDGVLVTLQSAP